MKATRNNQSTINEGDIRPANCTFQARSDSLSCLKCTGVTTQFAKRRNRCPANSFNSEPPTCQYHVFLQTNRSLQTGNSPFIYYLPSHDGRALPSSSPDHCLDFHDSRAGPSSNASKLGRINECQATRPPVSPISRRCPQVTTPVVGSKTGKFDGKGLAYVDPHLHQMARRPSPR